MRVLLDELAGDGARTTVRVPEHEVHDPGRILGERPPDLVLLKSATTLALSLAVADESYGVRFLNGARATLRAHDKAATLARLAAAGLPVPETYLVEAGEAETAPDASGEWVAKPTRGVHGQGVGSYPDLASALDARPASEPEGSSWVVDDGTRLIQRRIGGDEADVKVYVANGRCFAGSKAFGPASYRTDRIRHLGLDRRTAEMVLAAGETLGLRCFGLDLRYEGGRPTIIDANPFPGYRGFPEAVPALRSEIERSLSEATGP
jgi:ribosomal protein S6--L-glutamate ligase